jgi:membrane-associated phospholipid phosphatase
MRSSKWSAVIRVRHPVSQTVAVVWAAVATVSIVVMSAIVADGDVGEHERRVFDWFNGWPDWLEWPLWVLQQPGVLFFPVVVGAVLWLATGRQRLFWAFVVIVPAKMIIERLVIKQLVERERPYTSIGADIELRGHQMVGLSFPSGHTTTAFATAVLMMAFLPGRWRWLPLAVAGAVGAARIYFGEHSPLDVLAGAMLGTALAMLSRAFILSGDEAEGTLAT